MHIITLTKQQTIYSSDAAPASNGDGAPAQHEYAALDEAVIESWRMSGFRIARIELACEVLQDFKDHLNERVEHWNNLVTREW